MTYITTNGRANIHDIGVTNYAIAAWNNMTDMDLCYN